MNSPECSPTERHKPFTGYSAYFSASRTKSVRIELLTRQPTMRRANTSMTKIT